MKHLLLLLLVILSFTLSLLAQATAAPPNQSDTVTPAQKIEPKPRYTKNGELYRPDDFRTWVFVGAALGLGYSEHAEPYGDQRFTNVYIDPASYRHYEKTGQFPEQTILAMSVYKQSQKPANLPRLTGSFEGELISLEVAVKDNSQFEDGWAYFDFSGEQELSKTAAAFPRAKCFDCHAEHASDDNVFVQFYPVLRRLKAATTP